MSTEKPSKDDLLDELQSIRDFLTDHPLHEGDDQDIPTLTSVASEKLGIEIKKERKKTRSQNLRDHLSDSDPVDEHLVPILTLEEEDVPILQPEPFDAVDEAPVSDDEYIIDDSELHVPEQLRGGLFGGKDDEFIVEDPYATDDVYSPTPPPISEHSIIKDIAEENDRAHDEDHDKASPADARSSNTSLHTHVVDPSTPAGSANQSANREQQLSAEHTVDTTPESAGQHKQTLADTSISRAISDADIAHHKATQTEDSHYTLAKGSGENPFLPKHIRERLGKHQDIIDEFKNFDPAAASPARTSFKDTTSSEPTHADATAGAYQNPTAHIPEPRSLSDTLTHQFSNSQNASQPHSARIDTAIEEVLAEFMPKIEKRLREKLKSDVSAWNDEQ